MSTVNGKRKGISREDLLAVANRFRIKKQRALDVTAEVDAAVNRWEAFAEMAGVSAERVAEIGQTHLRFS